MSLLKFGKVWTATAIFAALAVFLCACGKGAADTTTTEPYISTPWSEAQVFTLPDETQAVSSPDGEDATSETQSETDVILRRIEAARAVYVLFSETRPQLDKTDSIEVEEGLFAYRVTDPQFNTMEKLYAYVSGYFSDELTQQLFNIGIYTTYEGKFYALDVGIQPPATGEMHVEVTEKTDASESYRLTIGREKDRTYQFVYAKQSDGKWVFTKFESY